MEISEVMTSTVHSILPNESVQNAAKFMLDNKVGSVIIESDAKKRKSLGIVTERDIVTRVVALGKDPSKVKVDNIATRPVVTVASNMDIAEAMRLMARLNIRRIVIVEGNEVVGIVTYRDLLRVAPSLLEIALEYEKIGFKNVDDASEVDYNIEEDYDKDSELEKNAYGLTTGYYCTDCGEWYDGAPEGYEYDGGPLCGTCIVDYEDIYDNR